MKGPDIGREVIIACQLVDIVRLDGKLRRSEDHVVVDVTILQHLVGVG